MYYEFRNFSQQNSSIFFFSISFFMLKATFIMHTKPFCYSHTAKSVRRRRKIFILIFIPFKNSDRLRKLKNPRARREFLTFFIAYLIIFSKEENWTLERRRKNPFFISHSSSFSSPFLFTIIVHSRQYQQQYKSQKKRKKKKAKKD